MWYVSRINTLDSRVLAARYFVNISSLEITNEETKETKVIDVKDIHSLNNVFGLDLNRQFVFETSEKGILLYSCIDFHKLLKSRKDFDLARNEYEFIVFNMLGNYTTLEKLFFNVNLCKIDKDYIVLLDRYVYKIEDKKLFTKLRTLLK